MLAQLASGDAGFAFWSRFRYHGRTSAAHFFTLWLRSFHLLGRLRIVSIRLGLLLLIALPLACENSSPSAPSGTNGGPGGGAGGFSATDISGMAAADGSTLKVSAPVPQSPISNVEVEVLTPTLTVANAQSPFVSGINFDHEFQVYRVEPNGGLTPVDSGTVPQGVGATSYVVENPLNDDTPHQWTARAVFQESHGPWSEMVAFRTNVPITILEPTLLQPVPGEVVDSVRPILEIENPKIDGDPGKVFVEFQVASDPNFQNIVAIVSEEMGKHAGIDTPLSGPAQSALSREEKTSAQVNVDLGFETVYYWRARGTNGPVGAFPAAAAPGSVTGEFSTPSFFKVATQAVVNAGGSSGVGGGGGGGGGSVSSGTADDELDLSQVTWLHHNVSSWPQTATITSTTIGAPPICINHTKVGQWPSGDFSGSGASVDSNVWVFAKIGGTWYAATWEWLRSGSTCKSLGATDFKTRVNDVSPLNSWTPKSGEQIGLMVSTPARLGPDGPVNERSNVVLRTWP